MEITHGLSQRTDGQTVVYLLHNIINTLQENIEIPYQVRVLIRNRQILETTDLRNDTNMTTYFQHLPILLNGDAFQYHMTVRCYDNRSRFQYLKKIETF